LHPFKYISAVGIKWLNYLLVSDPVLPSCSGTFNNPEALYQFVEKEKEGILAPILFRPLFLTKWEENVEIQ